MNLRAKMMIAFVGIVLVPTVALIILNDSMMTKAIRDSYSHKGKDTVERTVNYTFQKLSSELQNYISFTANDATFLRAAYYLNDIDSDADMQIIGPEFRKRLGISYLEVTNQKNIITFSTLPNRKGKKIVVDVNTHSQHLAKKSTVHFDFNDDIKEATIHTSAVLQWQDGEIGHIYGGYILDDRFFRDIAGPETMLGAYFVGPGILRSTSPIPLNQEQIDKSVNTLMSQCTSAGNDISPCEMYNYDTWNFTTNDGTPYLIVSGLLYIPGGLPIGILFSAEDAGVMYGDLAQARTTIVSLGIIFILVGTTLGYFASGSIVTPINRLTKELERLAETDQLTGARNRRAVTNIFRMEVSRALRGKTSFAVLLFDIDYFKRINDTHGHPTGDEVLKHIVKVAQATLRETDHYFRYGGEEFLVLLPIFYSQPIDENKREELDLASTWAAAERLRKGVKAQPIKFGGKTIDITISIGLAIFPYHGTNYEQLIRCADKALYQAKHDGRDRAIMYTPKDFASDDITENQAPPRT